MTVGLLLVIIGLLLSLTVVGAVIGIPLMIIGAVVFLFGMVNAAGKGAGEGIRGISKLFERRRVPCPFCAELIRPEAMICPHCRSALHEQNVGAPQSGLTALKSIAWLVFGQFRPSLSHAPKPGIITDESVIIRGFKFRTYETSEGWFYLSDEPSIEGSGGPYKSKISAMGAADADLAELQSKSQPTEQ